MDLEQLIAEGETISRPSLLLAGTPTDSDIVGYWGGFRLDRARDRQAASVASRHVIVTISEALFSELGLVDRRSLGAVGLFELQSTTGEVSHRAECDPRVRFRDQPPRGIPLHARAAPSFPPFEALCLHGSDRVAAWLRDHGLARHEYWQMRNEVVDAYQTEFRRRSPFHGSGVDVIVGGWPLMWPDDEFYAPPEIRLLFLTLRDAEPWYEVWYSPMTGSFEARRRIT